MTVTYLYPATGITPPTAAQMLLQNLLTVQVNSLDADTTGVITHNWGLSAAETAFYRPLIIPKAVVLETAGQLLTWVLPAANANQLSFNKTGAVGSGGTYIFDILRPHTLIQ